MLVVALLLGGVAPGRALELTGVLLHAAGPNGELSGPVWHTASGYGGRPLGFTRWPPPGTRGIPFPIAPDGRLVSPDGRPGLILWPVSTVTHLFWQFRPGEFPAAVVLNLYFNGDTSTPGISTLVFDRYGFTHFVPNPAPSTLSLYLDLAPNPATAEYSDGSVSARLAAAFFFSSSPSMPDRQQWRPSDFVNLDRVGTDRISPDGLPDGILIYQLDVLPASMRGSSPTRGRWNPPFRGLPPASSAGTVNETRPGFESTAPSPTLRSGVNTTAARSTTASTPQPSPGQESPSMGKTPETVSTLSPTEITPMQTPGTEHAAPETPATTARPPTTPTPKTTRRATTRGPGTATPPAVVTEPQESNTPVPTGSPPNPHRETRSPTGAPLALAPQNRIQ